VEDGLAAIHRELSAANGGNPHFLSYRDAAEAIGVRPQQAHDITGALVVFEVIEIVNKGDARPNGGKAAEFRYLLPQSEDGAKDGDGLLEIQARPRRRKPGAWL
jgi:hypothetical protein